MGRVMTRTSAPLRAGIYARRSIADGNEENQFSASVEDQIADCRKLAQRLGWQVVEVYPEDATSAFKKRVVTLPDGRRVRRNVRPVWQRLLDDLDKGRIDALIAYDLDRSMREPRDLEDLIEIVEQRKRAVESVTGSLRLSNDTEILAARIGVAVANKSSRDTSRRVGRASLRRAKDGEWHGGRVAPVGFELVWGEVLKKGRPVQKVTGLRLHPERSQMLRDAAARLLDGESLYAICNAWNARDLMTPEGAHWRSSTLRRALISPMMIGKRHHKEAPGELFDTDWPELLDRQTWERVRDLLEHNGRLIAPLDGSYASKRALGGGVTICGVVDPKTGKACRKKLVSQRHRGEPRLICHKQATGGCGVVTVNYAALEGFVLDMVLARLDSKEFRAELSRERKTDDGRERDLRTKLRELDQNRKRAQRAFVVGIMTEAESAAEVRSIDEEFGRLRERLAELTAGRLSSGVRNSADARALWDAADVAGRRRFIQSLVSAVVVDRWPAGLATNLTARRGESVESLKTRKDELMRDALRRRVKIEWRR
jgi:site-specific DNA recombinase